MIVATTDELLEYVADVIERAERFGAIVLPSNDHDEVAWEQDGDDLLMHLEIRPPLDRRSRPVDLVLQERWVSVAHDRWELVAYGYELRHHELDYRRALHRHDVEYFVRTYSIATHEHCEAPIGSVPCAHYSGDPVRGALDGLNRLYDLWLTGSTPDCSLLRCLG